MDQNPPLYLSLRDFGHVHGLGEDSQLLGLSLQEMIDTDIKEDFDDFTCANASGTFGTMEGLELFSDMDFKLEDDMIGSSNLLNSHAWSSSMGLNARTGIYDTTLSNSSALSNSYLEDMTGATSVMVNPNNVMPLHHNNPTPPPPQQKQQQLIEEKKLSVNTHKISNVVTSRAPTTPPLSFSTQTPTVIVTQTTFNGITTTTSSPLNRGIKTLKILPPMSSTVQQHATSIQGPPTPTSQIVRKKPQLSHPPGHKGKDNGFPKPAYSYSCLIALALKNSQTGSMSVSEIYKFMCEHFPYFKTAPSGWKNSVRHNLSLNKCFEKIEKPASNGSQRKGCLWGMNPAKITKMEEEVAKWSRKDPMGIKKGMQIPENLESLERGELVKDYSGNSAGTESEDDDDPKTPTSVSSQGSQGYDSAGSDFVDVEGFTSIADSSLPELNLQASGGIFEELESDGTISFFQANYSIVHNNPESRHSNTLVLHKQAGQKIFSI